MAYVVVLLATRWGSELGGLNVFNRGLAEGMTEALPKGSRTICFVEQLPSSGNSLSGVELFEAKELTAAMLVPRVATLCAELEPGTLQGVLLVGHDIITGTEAVGCAKLLSAQMQTTEVKSAVVGHMDYSEYAFKKNVSAEEVAKRSARQRTVIADADFAFAVGPLLQRNFASARSVAHRPRSPVRPLTPGVGRVTTSSYNDGVGLRFFMSGRLNTDDDPIKNSVMAVKALAMAYALGRKSNPDAWNMRGQLFAWGVDPANDANLILDLKRTASDSAHFELQAVAFSSDQSGLHQTLSACQIALMPSWHEGFGLSGWEALCAGVPLVCSRQSGLAMLLDELKQQFPELSLENVEFINIAGTAANSDPSKQDIEHLAHALLRMVQNIEQRKRAALELASVLKREFSWKRCASDLLGATGWYFPGSVRWPARQMASRQSQSHDVLSRILGDLNGLDLEEDWGDLTTAFNALSRAGKEAKLQNRIELYGNLRAIGSAIGTRLDISGTAEETARDSGRMDVCWRYMAACATICQSFREFSEAFPSSMLQMIWKDVFLTKELLSYACSFADEFAHQASVIAPKFFAPIELDGDDRAIAVRLARLATKYTALTQVFPHLESDAMFLEVSARCLLVTEQSHDAAMEIEKDARLASTSLALMSLAHEPTRQVADQSVAFFRFYQPDAGKVKGHWRGDKRLFAALATASLSTRATLAALRHMALDEDESIRWASLHLAFSLTLRRRLESAVVAGNLALDAPLNHVLGSIVDTAVTTDVGHPWLNREFLSHYLEERSLPAEAITPKPLCVLDFPVARWLIGPVIGETAPVLRGTKHPEVVDARTVTLQAVKRILLVLPPIEIDDDASGASRTSTPALGLGLLASQLAREGHDVQIADCHRHPKLRAEVLRLARTFDLIGFNTVFSTITSTMNMLADIRNRTQSTILVVGGPAAKLDVWRFSTVHVEDAQAAWDFAIASNAVENLSALVASLKTPGPWPSATGLIANRQSWAVMGRGLEVPKTVMQIHSPKHVAMPQQSAAWLQVMLDRRIYRAGKEQYEPARTRSQSQGIREAHVVMSQGCDWDCTFCTERKSKSGGEQRRDAAHVLEEIRTLASQHAHFRIQFVDDNLLPQIASDAKRQQVKQSEALAWTSEFLEGLVKIRADAVGSFGWRGIFRIEDFFAYEAQFATGCFIEQLKRAGCRMLAFGVEHGSTEQRRKNKVARAVVENDLITDLFRRLRAEDIFTKAYFMLGGTWETQETALQTIDFAIESGATLAYFALYKDFARATSVLSKEQQVENLQAKSFISYRQLLLDWDSEFSVVQRETTGTAHVQEMHTSDVITEGERGSYRLLSQLGFRFTDLVKYNDFHDEEVDGGTLLRAMTWDSPAEYFKTVKQAYRRFYLRPAFVKDYGALLEHGY
jgi:radical SAM superfamily enzyme YgiQ (UPF0313 family)